MLLRQGFGFKQRGPQRLPLGLASISWQGSTTTILMVAKTLRQQCLLLSKPCNNDSLAVLHGRRTPAALPTKSFPWQNSVVIRLQHRWDSGKETRVSSVVVALPLQGNGSEHQHQ